VPENEKPYAIVWYCLHDTTFSRFSRRVTDSQTDTRLYGIYRAIMALLGKTLMSEKN